MKVFARSAEGDGTGVLVAEDGRGPRLRGACRRTFTCRYPASDTYLGHTDRLTFNVRNARRWRNRGDAYKNWSDTIMIFGPRGRGLYHRG